MIRGVASHFILLSPSCKSPEGAKKMGGGGGGGGGGGYRWVKDIIASHVNVKHGYLPFLFYMGKPVASRFV